MTKKIKFDKITHKKVLWPTTSRTVVLIILMGVSLKVNEFLDDFMWFISNNFVAQWQKSASNNESRLKKYKPGNLYLRVRISTVDLLVLISLDQLILYCNLIYLFFTKPAILMRRSTVLNLPLLFVFHALTFKLI